MENETIIDITAELDIIRCRKMVREIAIQLGFNIADQTRMVTATSELARNIVNYATKGRLVISIISRSSQKGIMLKFSDNGPGFDPQEAMQLGFTTSKGLGMGLPGSKRLMDDFEVTSQKGKGSTITAVKWLKE